MINRRCEPNRWKGFLLGTAGSVVGLILMRQYFQQIAPIISSSFGDQEEDEDQEPQPLDDVSLAGQQYKEDESSTAALGRMIYQQIAGKEPQTQETKTALSYLVHWIYGMLQGGFYGVRSSSAKGLNLKGGLLYGTLLWLFGDEFVVPLLGLQSGPTAVPLTQHANRLGAHLAYGVGTAVTTQILRWIF